MDITTVLVNYKTGDLVSQYLDCLLSQKNVKQEIIVIDNDSQDNSLENLYKYRDKYPDIVQVIANDTNAGFGNAVNIAFVEAKGRYFYTINPDAQLQDENALAQMIKFMDAHPELGMAATLIQNESGKIMPTILMDYPQEAWLKHKLPNMPGKIAWVWGTSMILPSKVFKELNGFNKIFFMNYEDVDLSLRVRKAGYAIGKIEDIVVTHIGCVSRERSEDFNKYINPTLDLFKFYSEHYHPEDIKFIITKQMQIYLRKYRFHKLRKMLTFSKDADYRMKKYQAFYAPYYKYHQEHYGTKIKDTV